MTIPFPGVDPDASILERCRSGDPTGLADAVGRHGDRIYRTLVLIVRDAEDARDLTQETSPRRGPRTCPSR